MTYQDELNALFSQAIGKIESIIKEHNEAPILCGAFVFPDRFKYDHHRNVVRVHIDRIYLSAHSYVLFGEIDLNTLMKLVDNLVNKFENNL